MEVLILAAGKSKRYKSSRPKYSLSDYRGVMMLEGVISEYISKYPVTVILNKINEKNYPVIDYLNSIFKKKINWIKLDKFTNGPAETAYNGIKYLIKKNFSSDFEILIRDCDGFFKHINPTGNYVVASNILDYVKQQKGDLKNKSYLKINKFGIINEITEKKVISNFFSVGGYKFSSAKRYCKLFNELKLLNNKKQEIFVSHVVEKSILSGDVFKIVNAINFIDLGTINEWKDYNKKPVLLCDIDGTIFKAQFKGQYNKKPEPLSKNINFIKKMQKKGSQLIFLTARPKKYSDLTKKRLKGFGFTNFQIISGLNNSARILINDYNELNPYPRAISINIRRDYDNLDDYNEIV